MAAALLIFAAGNLFARETVTLRDGWEFRYGWDFAASRWEKISLPHTWNTADKESDHPYTRTMGLYRTSFAFNPSWNGKRLFLRFNGAATVADVMLNDRYVGRHKGGYTAFCFEITDLLERGKTNRLSVRLSNAETSDVIPLTGDFNIFGGLYRSVELIAADKVCVSPLDYASSGVYITQTSLSNEKAGLSVKVKLLNEERTEQTVSVEIDGRRFTGKGVDEAVIAAEIENPRRWNGVADPFLYTAVVRVGNDKVTETFGVREFSVDADRGFFLNGNPIRLNGVCRHQEREGKLSALTEEDHLLDIKIMKEMGSNALRAAHYPQAKEIYEACDREGLLVWAEIPFVGPGGYDDTGYLPSPYLHENIRTQLIEMIRQNYNHPSIVTWGLFNELKMSPNPVPFLEELNRLAKEEDPSRPTVAATNLLASEPLTFVTDLIAWNQYLGWYGGTPAMLGIFLDAVHQRYPELKIAVSEYGAGASVLHHEEAIRKPQATGKFHPEAYQTEYHIQNWKALKAREFVWGTFIWNLFDFSASHRTEGDRDGINDKGLVTHDRKEYKDAFYFYQANWRDDIPVLHLCEKRFTDRGKKRIFVRAFSNVGKAELFVNGESAGIAEPDDLRCLIWKNVKLNEGENQIELKAVDGTAADSCVWNFKQ